VSLRHSSFELRHSFRISTFDIRLFSVILLPKQDSLDVHRIPLQPVWQAVEDRRRHGRPAGAVSRVRVVDEGPRVGRDGRCTPQLAPLGAEGFASPGVAPGCPFGAGPESGGATGSENPYQSPGAYAYGVPPGQPDPFAAQRVSAPATALIVTAVLGIIAQSLGIVVNLLALGIGVNAAARNPEGFPIMFGNGAPVVMGVSVWQWGFSFSSAR